MMIFKSSSFTSVFANTRALVFALAALVTLTPLSTTVATPASAAEVQWRLAHYLQEEHFFAAGWLTDWVEELERRSDGRIKVDVHPNNSLLRLAAIAPGVRDGIAEIGFGPAPESPALELLELPFIAESAVHGTHIAMSLLADQPSVKNDLAGLHVAVLQTNAPSLIHTKDKPVRVPADLQGLKMRGATDYIRDMLGVLGAEPVAGYLAPQVYGLLEAGTVDGTLWPYEAIRIFNLGEQANHHTEMYFFVSVLGLFINAEALNALPDDLRAVVLDMSGPDVARSAALEWDQEEQRGRDKVIELGNTILTPTAAQRAAWRRAAQPLIDQRLTALSRSGFNANQRYRHLLETAASLPTE
ncbi:MAG: TRAP transporter substrate-binding protein DctP [Rhodospirillaceae bacterium]